MASNRFEYDKNINTEKDNQKKIYDGLKSCFNYYGLNIVSNEIITDVKLQNKGIDRCLIVEDMDGTRAKITGDDKNQRSVKLLDRCIGKQSNQIYFEYKRHYLDDNNNTVKYSKGIFSRYKQNDLILILTGDDYLVIIDMVEFRKRWSDCNYRNSLIVDYSFHWIETDSPERYKLDFNKINQNLYKRDSYSSYCYNGYYLRLTYEDLVNDDRLKDMIAIVDINDKTVVY